MEKFDLTLFKPNQLIEIEGGYITPVNRLAYNYIIHKLQKNKTHLIKLNIADFFKDLDLGKNYNELVSYLDSLQKIRVISKDSKGKLWGAFNLLSYFKKNDDGTFEVEIPSIIFNALCNNDKEKKQLYYTAIKLLEEKSFRCSYTMIFYEIFKKYEKDNINIPIYDLETLKKITGTELKYKDYKDFKRYVLKKSLDELNNFEFKYHYTYDEIKLGRKVDKIRFIRTDKTLEVKTEQAKTLPNLSEKLLLAIEKSKKNRFVQKKYSQRAVDNAVKQFGEDLVAKGLIKLYDFEKSISSFAKILNATIDDIKRSEAVKNQGINTQENSEKTVKNEITGSKKLQNQENSFDKLLQMVSTQSTEQIKEFPTEKKVKFYTELAGTKNIEDLKKFCDKYNLIINLELFEVVE